MKLSNEEEKNLIGVISGHLISHTRFEVRGSLTEEGIKSNSILRNLLEKILTNQNFEIESEYALGLGLTSRIDEAFLQEVSLKEGSDWGDLPSIAKYFLKEIEKTRQ